MQCNYIFIVYIYLTVFINNVLNYYKIILPYYEVKHHLRKIPYYFVANYFTIACLFACPINYYYSTKLDIEYTWILLQGKNCR